MTDKTELDERIDQFMQTYRGLAEKAGVHPNGVVGIPPLICYKAADESEDSRPYLTPILVKSPTLDAAWEILRDELDKLYAAYGPATWISWSNLAFRMLSEDPDARPGDLHERYLAGDPAIAQALMVMGFSATEKYLKVVELTTKDGKIEWGKEVPQEGVVEIGGIEDIAREYII